MWEEHQAAHKEHAKFEFKHDRVIRKALVRLIDKQHDALREQLSAAVDKYTMEWLLELSDFCRGIMESELASLEEGIQVYQVDSVTGEWQTLRQPPVIRTATKTDVIFGRAAFDYLSYQKWIEGTYDAAKEYVLSSLSPWVVSTSSCNNTDSNRLPDNKEPKVLVRLVPKLTGRNPKSRDRSKRRSKAILDLIPYITRR